MRKKLFALVALFGALFVALNGPFARAEPLPPTVRHMTPGARVMALANDREGFLWLGTEAGPVRYDGRTFLPLTTAHGQPQQVSAILFDARGSMWLGQRGQHPLQRMQSGRRLESVFVGSGVTEVLCLAQRAAEVWICTDKGLFRHSDEGAIRVPMGAFDDQRINALLQVDDDTMWVGTEHALVLLKGGTVARSQSPGASALVRDSDGRIWVGRAPSNDIDVLDQAGDMLGSFPTLPVTALLADDDGSTWIATRKGLLRSLHMSTPEPVALGRQYDLRLTAALRDIDGTLWLGTQSSGALQVDTNPAVRVLAPSRIIDDPFAFSIAEDSDQHLWVSGRTALLRFEDEVSEASLYGPQTKLPYALRALSPAAAGGIWGASPTEGAFRISKSSGGTVSVDRFTESGTLVVFEEPTGTTWFGWSKGNLGRSTQGAAAALVKLPGDAVVRAIIPARQGGLWLASNAGVLRLRPNEEVDVYGLPAGLSHGNVFSLHQFRNGVLCAGTAAGGLDCLSDGGKFRHYGLREGFTNEVVGSIVEDAQGVLWLGTSGGIFRVQQPPAHNQAKLPARMLGLGAGLPSVECIHAMGPSGLALKSGAVVFATTVGVARLDTRKLAAQDAPAVVIDRMVLNGQTVQKDLSDWPVGSGNLQIHYAAPRFQRADALSFRYRLDGQDVDWVKADARQVAIYTNLRPGRYRFLVAVDDGDSHSEASTAFVLHPPFHKSPIFIVGSMLSLLAAMSVVMWLRAAAARDRRADIVSERTRLARELHDTVEQNVVAVRIELDGALEALEAKEFKQSAQQHVVRAVDLLGRTSQGMRAAIHALRMPEAKPPDLAMAISNSAGRLLRNSDVAFELEVQGQPYLPTAVQHQHLVAVVEEALTNALKHASAHKIFVRISHAGATGLVLEVVDDGCGFDTSSSKEGHYGLHGMRERAQIIGGRIEVKSQAGMGTRVVLTVPLQKQRGG